MVQGLVAVVQVLDALVLADVGVVRADRLHHSLRRDRVVSNGA